MLARADFPAATALEMLTRHAIEAALLVPTPTGLEKSIFDATDGLREYLAERGYHDYATQAQGQDHKVLKQAYLVRPHSLEPTQVSLYRPTTKNGDPRIWLGHPVRSYAGAFNLLALTVIDGTLYVLNMSDPSVQVSLDDAGSPFRKLVDRADHGDVVASELLGLLRQISSKGYLRTLRPGDTGIGFTLETMLGISANSKQAPDYKGIELKAKRSRIGADRNRSTLFSKVPNWKLSPVGNALGLLKARGYVDGDGRLSLYHTLSARGPNSLGLALDIDAENDWLRQVYHDPSTRRVVHDVTWEIPILKNDLAAKHRQTFWVRAMCRGAGQDEEFHYVEVQRTRRPMTANFVALVEAGIITVDYALHKKSETRARDQGYLFKIHPDNLGALFPPPEVHALS
ncbi:MAG: MvaI/BcnI family restriction endonuclease [Hyphomicrobium sp.]